MRRRLEEAQILKDLENLKNNPPIQVEPMEQSYPEMKSTPAERFKARRTMKEKEQKEKEDLESAVQAVDRMEKQRKRTVKNIQPFSH